jgi:hypothetical protein
MTEQLDLVKNCTLIIRVFFIVLFYCYSKNFDGKLFLSFKNVIQINIIVEIFGQIPVAIRPETLENSQSTSLRSGIKTSLEYRIFIYA